MSLLEFEESECDVNKNKTDEMNVNDISNDRNEEVDALSDDEIDQEESRIVEEILRIKEIIDNSQSLSGWMDIVDKWLDTGAALADVQSVREANENHENSERHRRKTTMLSGEAAVYQECHCCSKDKKGEDDSTAPKGQEG
ncbi:hypothetical protein HAX54_043550 [Datura stramonium]|uniref:Uncharacterized protein n=1 Tax=Datura stramonium TaxID=4076 RepID=A0ABS8W2X8_DATST|nr:hypothetical protein [Datura stramonium]